MSDSVVYTLQINEHQRALLVLVAAAVSKEALAELPRTAVYELLALVNMLDDLPNAEREAPGITHTLHL